MKYKILVFLVLTSISLAQDTSCLKYEPKIETVVGRLEKVTFPGPPNFESIKNGDKAEVYWILKLGNNICVINETDDDINTTELNVSEIQIVLNQTDYKKYSKFVGKMVSVVGTLFHSSTVHHKTRVLLLVKNISAG